MFTLAFPGCRIFRQFFCAFFYFSIQGAAGDTEHLRGRFHVGRFLQGFFDHFLLQLFQGKRRKWHRERTEKAVQCMCQGKQGKRQRLSRTAFGKRECSCRWNNQNRSAKQNLVPGVYVEEVSDCRFHSVRSTVGALPARGGARGKSTMMEVPRPCSLLTRNRPVWS